MEIDLFGSVIVQEEEAPKKPKKKSPFDYIKNISKNEYPTTMEGYSSWIVNSSLSMRKDTVFYANEINKYHHLPDQMQFDFYYHSLGGNNLFAKWLKAPQVDTESIKVYYDVSNRVAEMYSRVINDNQKKQIQSWYENRKGGK